MGVNQHNKFVTLSRSPQASGDSDGFFEDLSPPRAWCSIQPVFGGTDGRSQEHVVEMRFHPQVSMDTRIVYHDAVLLRNREFFVRGVQNIDEANDLMRLACEEIVP